MLYFLFSFVLSFFAFLSAQGTHRQLKGEEGARVDGRRTEQARGETAVEAGDALGSPVGLFKY